MNDFVRPAFDAEKATEATALYAELDELLNRIEALDFRRGLPPGRCERSAWIEHARREALAATAATEPAADPQAPYEDEE